MKLIKEMEIEEETKFNQRQREMIEDKITGFYDEILSHPALQDSRVVFHPKVPHYKTILPYSEKVMSNDNEQPFWFPSINIIVSITRLEVNINHQLVK